MITQTTQQSLAPKSPTEPSQQPLPKPSLQRKIDREEGLRRVQVSNLHGKEHPLQKIPATGDKETISNAANILRNALALEIYSAVMDGNLELVSDLMKMTVTEFLERRKGTDT